MVPTRATTVIFAIDWFIGQPKHIGIGVLSRVDDPKDK